ncbi:hypothetical protein ACU8OG_08335 [Rhizobium leguminosarum]
MNSQKCASDPRKPLILKLLSNGSANIGVVPVSKLSSAGPCDRVIEEEQARIRRMCRLTYVHDRNTRSNVGLRVGPTMFKMKQMGRRTAASADQGSDHPADQNATERSAGR